MHKFAKSLVMMLLVIILALSTAIVASADDEPMESICVEAYAVQEEVLEGTEELELLNSTIERTLEIGYVLLRVMNQAGLVVAVVDAENDFTWVHGFGYADTINGIPVTEDTIFGLASISKVFTAIAVMQLVEDGIIGLDDTIVELLPGFSALPDQLTGTADYRNITVRMLLSHTSGLFPDVLSSGTITAGAHESIFMQDFLEILSGFQSVAPETTAFAYANNNFTLLGVLLAKLAGFEELFYGFESLMQENIFMPLGMNQSAFILDERHLPYLSMNYQDAETQEERLFYNFLPTGGLNSSAFDMSRFMTAILRGGEIDGNRILDQTTLSQMMTPQDFGFENMPNMFGNFRFGLGFHLAAEMNGFTHWGHGGTLVHHHSYFALDMDSSIGVFVATNSVSGLMMTPGALAGLVLQWAVEEKTGELNLPESDPDVYPIELSIDDLQIFEGFYVLLGVADELARLEASTGGFLYFHNFPGLEETLRFWPLSDGSFVDTAHGIIIWLDDSYEDTVLFFGEFRSAMFGVQINEDFLTLPDSFYEWVGTYQIVLDEPQHRAIIETLMIGVDPEFGFAYMRPSTKHGLDPFTPLMHLGGGVFLGFNFVKGDQEAELHFLGMVFRRVG